MISKIKHSFVNELTKRIDIVELISEYVPLKKRGADWWACCPFHNEKTPSFSVSPSQGFYYCFGCHVSGNAINFIMEQEKISYTDTIRMLAKKAGMEIEYEDEYGAVVEKKLLHIDDIINMYERTAGMFHYLLTQTAGGKDALSYVKNRGLTDETIEKFKLGYAPRDPMWLHDFLLKKGFSDDFLKSSGLFTSKNVNRAFFYDRLMFPIFNRRGQVVAFGGRIFAGDAPKYLNSSDLLQYKKGETLYAFNFAKAKMRETKAVILCEGYMDVIAYHQCDITYAVAPLGTALTKQQLQLVKPFVDTILLSFDTDKAGLMATNKAILMCRKMGFTVKIIQLIGGKDPAEIMINSGKEVLTKYVNNAILDNEFLIASLHKQFKNTPEGKAKACLSFFPYLDSLELESHKESCIEMFARSFDLDKKLVMIDYRNKRVSGVKLAKTQEVQSNNQTKIQRDSQLSVLYAVLKDFDQFAVLKKEVTLDDFDNENARKLYEVMCKCYDNNALNLCNIMSGLANDEALRSQVAIHEKSDEFTGFVDKAVERFIKQVMRKRLEIRRSAIERKIKDFSVSGGSEDELKSLLSEKIDIDRRLCKGTVA